jgi:hypothetical protein
VLRSRLTAVWSLKGGKLRYSFKEKESKEVVRTFIKLLYHYTCSSLIYLSFQLKLIIMIYKLFIILTLIVPYVISHKLSLRMTKDYGIKILQHVLFPLVL